MRELCALGLTALVAVAAACSSDSGDTPSAHDAGQVDAGSDASDDWQPPPVDSGPKIHCTLDNGTDPVALCTQKRVLSFLHQAAWLPAVGVAESWDSTTFTPDADDAGAPRHQLVDDAAYAAACASYHASSTRYGDDEILGTVDADLVALADRLTTELAVLPKLVDGELYLHLRRAAGGLRVINENARADALDARAEAYARALFTDWYHPLASGDAGSDGMIGDLAGAAIAYQPDRAAAAAVALSDLAQRHAKSDAGDAAALEAAAAATLSHLLARARDPATGLYFRALTTSSDPAHDALADLGDGLPSDVASADVEVMVGLSLSRVAELAAGPPALGQLNSLGLDARADQLLTALFAKSVPLWDGNDRGLLLAWSPGAGSLVDWKTTHSNAFALALVHRSNVRGSAKWAADQPLLKSLLLDQKPPHTSLLSVVGSQQSWFRAVPASYDFAVADAAAPFDREQSYFASSITDACEALDELWLGLP